jgi:PAS domain S-box-containing protein
MIIPQEHWHNILEHLFGNYEDSNLAVGFFDLGGKIVSCNQKMCSLLEYTEDELINIGIEKIIHPVDLIADTVMIKRVKDGEVKHYEVLKRFITKTCKVIWFKTKVWPIMENGKVVIFCKMIEPINGDKQKVEKIGDNMLQVRSTITLLEFVADNWKSVVAALVFLISTIITFGTQFYIMSNEVKTINESQQEHKDMILELIKGTYRAKP